MRQALLGKLLKIIGQRVKLGFATVVHCKEFKKIFNGKHRVSIGSVYKLCCTACYLEVGEWARDNYQIEPIAYFFDAGHRNSEEVSQGFIDSKSNPENIAHRLGSITFTGDTELVPLQAADLAAYEHWKWLDEHFADKTRHGRYPLQKLVRIPWKIREFDRPILEEMLEHRKTGK